MLTGPISHQLLNSKIEALMKELDIPEILIVVRKDERGDGAIIHKIYKSKPQLIDVVKRLQNDITFTNPH